jgi:NAD(P)-dependent dehydrogenase (short-subunit alcohol dehydrogenase family)
MLFSSLTPSKEIQMTTLLITGASSGIGNAAARLFASKGWNVVATMRDPQAGADLAKLDNVLVARLDVQDKDSIDGAIAAGIARFGRIDTLVNNAGYGQFGLFEAASADTVQQQFDVNVFGVMNTIRAILPHFRASQGGAILNVSSGAGMFTLPLISLYCASKFALEGFTEALSYELASQNIAVKLVIPHGGVTSTRFNARSAKDFVADPALASYDEFVARTHAAFARMVGESSMGSGDVAALIYEALTDGSDRLRYLIGDDKRGFVKARRELSEEGYMDFMRACFEA